MKKLLTVILSAMLIFQTGVSPALACNIDNPDGNELQDDSKTEEAQEKITLSYDERYSFSHDYEDYKICSIESVEVTSRKVVCGSVLLAYDDAVLTQDAGSDTDVIATGVGTAKVTLIKDAAASNEEMADVAAPATDMDSEYTPDTIVVEVTVAPARLTLMFVSGQSNAEGWCSANTGYQRDLSISCQPGMVYSTYAPTYYSIAKSITGISFSDFCTQSNAGDFVAGALTGSTSRTGNTLEYPLDSLTEDGAGKTGIDSGLAYQWNQLTGDKVWIVNAAWGGSSVSSWIPDASLYERARAVYNQAYFTYCAEVIAGHYSEGDQLLFWLQGEHDKDMTASQYGSYFREMYEGLLDDFGYLDGIGVISVRSSIGTNRTEDELQMTGPRIVQYLAGASDDYEKLYIVSNVNEQWVSDAGVASYFSEKYGESLSYPMRGTESVPETMAEVHNDIHYSQIGHNENGLTAAEGLYHALQNDEYMQPKNVNWHWFSGEQISKLYVLPGQAETVVPVADPVYAAKEITFLPDNVNYDAVSGQVLGEVSGDGSLIARIGEKEISSLDVSVSDEWDFTDAVGEDYTDFYYCQGKWYYFINGKASINTYAIAEGTVNDTYGLWYVKDGAVSFTDTIAKDDNGCWYIRNGQVDFDYYGVAEGQDGWWRIEGGQVNFDFTGFAENSNGWWYLEDGKVQFDMNDVIEGTVQGTEGWWYVENGQVVFTDTVAKNNNGWWRIEGGQVNFDFTGFAENSNGWWYLEDGKVQFDLSDVIEGTVQETEGWWYVENGQVVFTDTVAKNNNGWWYVKDGMVDFGCYGVEKNNNGWWRIEAGKVNFTYNGFAENGYGWWYLKGGKVQFGINDVMEGIVLGTKGWWYVENGQVMFTDTVAKNSYGWWKISYGKVNFYFNGIARNQNGWWYICGGKVDFSYNGNVTVNGSIYRVVDGMVYI